MYDTGWTDLSRVRQHTERVFRGVRGWGGGGGGGGVALWSTLKEQNLTQNQNDSLRKSGIH